jgi:hypothetical protein
VAVNWATIGVQHSPTTANKLLTAIGYVIANPHYRYVWRGQSDVAWALHTSIHRRLLESKLGVTNGAMVRAEVQLLSAARAAGYDVLGGRKLSSVELLALLQHEGAATRFFDVTPDPFIALFFACEHARVTDTSAGLVAIRIEDDQVARDLREPDRVEEFSVLETVQEGARKRDSPYFLWQPPPLNERIKAQRGMFLMGGLPDDQDVYEYSSIQLGLLNRALEKTRVSKLLAPSTGRYIADGGPRLVIFRISPTLRRSLQQVLATRFGYTTQTVYPDFNGFAQAHSWRVLLDGPG